MCQNSHLAHKLTPYHPKNTFLAISSLARNVPDMWPPASIDPEYLKSVIMESPDPPPHSLPHRCLHYWTGPGNLTVLANPFCYLWFHFWCFCIIPDTPIAPCPGLPCCYSEPQKEEVYGTPKLDIEPYIWTRKCKSLIFLMLLYPLCFSTLLPILPPHSDSREGMEYSKTSNTWTRKYLPTQEANTDKN